MKNFKKIGVLISISLVFVATITTLAATNGTSIQEAFSSIIRYEFKDLKTIPDGTMGNPQENEQPFTFEPVSISGGWLYNLSGGDSLNVSLGSITDGQDFEERYIDISGKGGTVRLLMNSYSYGDEYCKTHFWSAKQLDGNTIVKDFNGDIKSVVLFETSENKYHLVGYQEGDGIDFWSLDLPQTNYFHCVNPLALQQEKPQISDNKINIDEAKELIITTDEYFNRNTEFELIEITPIDVWDKTGCQLFKVVDGSSLETFVIKDGKSIHIGLGFGGFGITSVVPFDADDNGIIDIVYAYSWGSGVHRSVISWFNMSSLTEHPVDETFIGFRGYDLILKTDNEQIFVYCIEETASFSFGNESVFETLAKYPSIVDINSMTLKKDGVLVWENGELHNRPSYPESTAVNQIESFFEEVENRSFEVLFPILVENEDCYKITVTGKTEGNIYPINVFAVNLKDNKKYFLNESNTYERFYCVPKFACKTSPDGRLRIESVGMYMDGPSGLHQLKETRIVDMADGNILFSISSSLSDNFLWSPDSRFISVENSGRTWGMTEIIDTTDMSKITLPDSDDILNSYSKTTKPSDNNPLLCFQALNWVSDSVINVNFEWQTEKDTTVFGTYYYNVFDKTVEIKMIDEKNQG